MPKRFPEQMTFESGELSPFLYGRTDLSGYQSSLKTAINMIVDSRGGILSRRGFEFQYEYAAGDKTSRMFRFRKDYLESFVVNITGTEITVSDSEGTVGGGGPGSVNLITNPSFTQGSVGWDDDSIGSGYVEFVDNEARLVSGASGDQDFESDIGEIHQEVTGLVIGNLHRLQFKNQLLSSSVREIQLRVGSTRGDNDIYAQRVPAGDTVIEFTPTVDTIHLAWRILPDIELGPPTPDGDPTFIKRSVTVSLDEVNLFDLAAGGPTGPVIFPSVYREDQLRDLQAEMAPDLQVMYFTHRDVPVYKLSLDITVNPRQWTFEPAVFDHGTGEDPWVTEYPGAVTFHQGRLILAGTYSNPVGIWASRAGKDNYDDFAPPTGSAPDESFFVILARNADIQWVKGGKNLFVGTDISEHIVRATGGVITATDISTEQFSPYGSARYKGNWVSEDIAHISQDRKRVRLLQYDSDARLAESGDITWQANHLFDSGVYEMHHVRNPKNQIWCLLGDGTIAVCTYSKEYNVMAWSRVVLQEGTFRSMIVIEEQARSVVYASVYRANRLRLVRLTESPVFMDEFVTWTSPIPTTFISGPLGYLDQFAGTGKKLWVTGDGIDPGGDGFVYPPAELLPDNIIIVDGPPSRNFVIGIPMQRKVETIFTEIYGGALSTAGMKKSWNRIGLRVIESAMPLINGSRPPSRVPSDLQDQAPPPYTGRFVVSNTGIDDTGIITVEQDLPLNLSITAIYGDLSEENI